MECRHCSKEVPPGSIVCPFCAEALESDAVNPPSEDEAATSAGPIRSAPDEAPTADGRDSTPTATSGRPSAHGRFLPGKTVAGRYRIVGLLGRGGMGEVYRADDLKLGLQVALKFLPDSSVASESDVIRLLDEVRMARKVSHPNVCRVFDVAEADGQHFVSMEYVDGEDLSSLLRRIGRLPEDKAIEISRQLCAALAAAHDEGVLHRDLKPANVMLDGRGRVKLTDFGLAGVAEVRAGTPIYMAPEVLAGEGVSVRSDLYSLGLVIHELFTGKRVFEAGDLQELSRKHESITSSRSLSSSTSNLDPAIERVVHRCLQKDPNQRPKSALAVSAGLPGADPLAAALAAGETPSPEMVAEAGGEGRLPLRMALPVFVFSIAIAVAVGILQSHESLVAWVPFDRSPATLDLRAEEIVTSLGYSEELEDTASDFAADLAYIRWLQDEQAPVSHWEPVSEGRPASILFWWRSSPGVLVPHSTGLSPSPMVSLSNPPRTTPGMISLQTDTLGRLVWFDAAPARVTVDDAHALGRADAATVTRAADDHDMKAESEFHTDWDKLFLLMGLETAEFTRVPPRLTPEHYADERAAWEGAFPEAPEAYLRIEAAALGGRPISVRWFTPWNPLEPNDPSESSSGITAVKLYTLFIIVTIILLLLTAVFGGLFVAQRNARSGRGDARGARRLGYVVAIGLGTIWLFGEHTYSPRDFNSFVAMLVFVGAIGGLTWALYLAVEPFLRRHAPETLIGWTRFIDGRLSDPLVGRDILFGCAAGALTGLLSVAPLALGERSATVGNLIGLPYDSPLALFGATMSSATLQAILALGLSFLYGLTFVALGRRPWVSYAIWLFFFGSMGFIPGLTVNDTMPAASILSSIFWTLSWALWFYVLFRRSILMFLVMGTTAALLERALPTLEMSAWYSSSIIAGFMLFVALTAWGFYRCAEWKGGLAEALAGD